MAYIQIQWTSESVEEARAIAIDLMKKKWVACANILPFVDSIYLWEGRLKEGKEVKVFFKTKEEFFARVRDHITKHASYDIPEISKISIADANPDYIQWVTESLSEE